MKNLGLVGGGYWGKNLIRDFNEQGTLHTICEINDESIEKYRNQYPDVNITKNWTDILENHEITSVCVSLPAEMHYKFAKQALLAYKDVYVEKPITLDLKEAEELVNLAEKMGKILMVGHLLHYHPCIEKIKEIICEGKIGKVKNIICNRLNLGKFRTQENVLWSFAPHDISVCLALCDDKLPESVICNGKDNITKGIHDITNSILKYDDRYVNINVNWLNPYKEQRMVIIGEKGMIEFDDTLKDDKLKLYENYIEWSNSVPSRPTPMKKEVISIRYDERKNPLKNECRHFIECCKTRNTPITDGKEGLRVLKVLNSLQKSLNQNGKSIYIQESKLKYFKHPSAVVDNGADIGIGTKIWHYSHICKGAKIGKNCNIGQNVYISGGAVIGDNCKVQNNVSIYAGVKAGNYVFFGPSCVLTNDINPRGMYSKCGEYIDTVLEDGVTLGANCTIVCGNTLGKHSLIGAGSVICKDVEAYSIMVGNPGRKIGTIDEKGNRKIY